MNVLCITDKPGSAIDRLATGMAPYHDNLKYHVLPIHPKRPDEKQIADWERLYPEADVIDFAYYKTAYMLMEQYDLSDKKLILQHHNPYSIHEHDWHEFDAVTVNNQTIEDELSKVRHVELIPNTVDTDFWTFNTEWNTGNRVLMVAARIESKKGVKEVAEACEKSGATLVLVGAVSDREYFNEVMEYDVEFHENITDEELRELYYTSTLHICNSRDNFESGTNPILESMLCGTPVLTRNIGHVPELYDEKNMILNQNFPDDVEHLSKLISYALENPGMLGEMRGRAWATAKARSNERRAYSYQKLYRSLFEGTPVSIITAVNQHPESTKKCLEAIKNQDYPNKELIVVEDDVLNPNQEIVEEFRKEVNFPVRYMLTGNSGYGLAQARNRGIIEATGDITVFCDQRIIMEDNAVTELVKNVQEGVWVYGSKGSEKPFVENFSAVMRSDVTKFGMFNERCVNYGALSQETRNRFKYQGNRVEFVPTAQAHQAKKGSKFSKHQDIIKSKNWLWKCDL